MATLAKNRSTAKKPLVNIKPSEEDDAIDPHNYKGQFYGKEQKEKYIDETTGAHFKYETLFQLLKKLQVDQMRSGIDCRMPHRILDYEEDSESEDDDSFQFIEEIEENPVKKVPMRQCSTGFRMFQTVDAENRDTIQKATQNTLKTKADAREKVENVDHNKWAFASTMDFGEKNKANSKKTIESNNKDTGVDRKYAKAFEIRGAPQITKIGNNNVINNKITINITSSKPILGTQYSTMHHGRNRISQLSGQSSQGIKLTAV